MEIRQTPQAMRRERRARWFKIIGSIVGVVAIVVAFFMLSTHPMREGQQRLTQLATDQFNLVDVKQYYSVSRDDVYTSLVGTNKKNQTIGVIRNNTTSELMEIDMSTGWSAKKVRNDVEARFAPKEITSFGMGIYDSVPVWLVTIIEKDDNLTLLTYQFSDGKIIRAIENL
ncbi:hypothetical protein OIT44_04300 [Weissella ceti]|uniref:DUF5590 domain-containing protein n=1 Tax=Weissella ceti TaxID=759620 RepID=A0ABT3E4F0_9LACO|nr:hypothetical protein [Weissella ceti]MCW0953296.1 hypothetical protein [Weissella ceti]QVK11403.1 hypothetical protein KHQ31_04055 [Weissella ceti]